MGIVGAFGHHGGGGGGGGGGGTGQVAPTAITDPSGQVCVEGGGGGGGGGGTSATGLGGGAPNLIPAVSLSVRGNPTILAVVL